MSDEHVKNIKKFIIEDLQKDDFFLNETYESVDGFIFISPSTLRLRYFGYKLLKDIYKNETFDLSERLTGKELMTLKNCVGWPYYLPTHNTTITLFTMKHSFILKLNGGDVKKWLSNLSK